MITITKDNIYYSETPLSLSSKNTMKIHKSDIIGFLNEYVELGESVTVKRIFDIILPNINKFNNIFYSILGGQYLEPFLQEIENNETEKLDIKEIELYWYCDKFENELNLSPSLHGILNDDDVCSIDFVSLNNIKNCVFKIDNNVELLDYNFLNKETVNTQDLGFRNFTLFEFFNGIIHEISMHGGPQDKSEIFKDIEESINQTDIDDLADFKKTNINIENIFEQIEDNDLYLVKYKNLKARVDINRVKNDKNISKLKYCLLEKLKIYDLIENNSDDLSKYYKKLTNLEYDMQMLYGEDEDISYHVFWETPKCICPRIDNIEVFPTLTPYFNDKCPIHSNR